MQKTITVNFLTHKRTNNKGQSPKYMIDENHLPIIDKEIFDNGEALDKRIEELKNALKKLIRILTPTHFVFAPKSGMRVEEIGK